MTEEVGRVKATQPIVGGDRWAFTLFASHREVILDTVRSACDRDRGEVTTPSVSRTVYVTEHYAHLQGLRLVPLGIPFVASAAWRTGSLDWCLGPGSHARAWFLISLAVALVVSAVIARQYRRRFGAVVPRASRSGALTLATSLIGLVVLVLRSPYPGHLPVPMAFVGLALTHVGCVEHGLRRHYLGLAAACVLFAMLPALGVPLPTRRVALDLLIGLGLIVAGLGDHAALQRVLQAPEGVPDVCAA